MKESDVSSPVWALIDQASDFLQMSQSELDNSIDTLDQYFNVVEKEIARISEEINGRLSRGDNRVPWNIKCEGAALTLACEALAHHGKKQGARTLEIWASYYWSQAAIAAHATERHVLGPAVIAYAEVDLKYGDGGFAQMYRAILDDFETVLDTINERHGKVNLNLESVAAQCLEFAAKQVLSLKQTEAVQKKAQVILERTDAMKSILESIAYEAENIQTEEESGYPTAFLTNQLHTLKAVDFSHETIMKEIRRRL
jgi:hypothetical protein